MGELKGYLGAVYAIGTVQNSVEASTGTGDGTTTDFSMKSFLSNTIVRPDTFSVRVSDEGSDVAYVWLRDFDLTPDGIISFHTAPSDGGDVLATYQATGQITQKRGFFNYAIDVSCDPLEDTDFSTTGWRTFKAGLTTWTASAEKHWHSSAAYGSDMIEAFKSDLYYVKFYDDTDNLTGYAGWAKVTGVSPNVAVDAVVTEGITMQGFDRMSRFSDVS